MDDPSLYETITSIVNSGYNTFQGFANDAFGEARSALQTLRTADFDQFRIPSDVGVNIGGKPGTFVPPPKPKIEIDDFERPDPVDPPDLTIPELRLPSGNAPERPELPKYMQPGGEPGGFTRRDPGDPDPLDPVAMPADPGDPNLPESPQLLAISIPEAPPIEEVAFEGVRPDNVLAVPNAPFVFTEQVYSSPLLTSLKAKLSEMVAGTTGLSAEYEQAVFERARSRESQTALKARQQVASEYAAKGFDEPPGMLGRRVLEIAQNTQNQLNTFNREEMIRMHEVRLDMLKFGITSGISLESNLIQAHLTAEGRRFEALKYVTEAALAIFNAQVALHNASVAQYQADAQVYRDRVQAEIAKVERFKALVDAQEVISEINKNYVDMYESQVRGVIATIDVYRARLDGARLRLEANNQTLEAHRIKVQSFSEAARAYAIQWDAYRSRVTAALGNTQAADAMARVYATDVQAWQTKHDVSFRRLAGEVSVEELRVRAFEAALRGYVAEIDAERARIAGQAQKSTAEASVYSAAGQIAQAESASADRSFQLDIERNNVTAQVALENARINLQGGLTTGGFYLESIRQMASTSGQLASASLAAINVNAGVSGSVGNSTSYNRSLSKSWGWAGETPDDNSPPVF